MVLKLYNTLTRTKEEFRPLDGNNVRMYVCGPTVYDYAHIGNARPVIVFDVLFRLLRHLYGADHVTYVRNITDVDDKINARAAEEGISIRELTERTAKQYHEDVAALGALPPTHEPRATEHIRSMIAMIERLIASGNAYSAEGHVLYDVSSKPDYGKLAKRSLDEMIAGARVEVAPYKRNPMDFVLWKPSKPGEPSWPSPWSNGRPGWHIECSAMSEALLGETFDIHGGGIDLVFPHHENEIAQSEAAHSGHPFARVWMHNGFLQVEGEKMSKSLGNFFTIRDLLKDWPGEVLRFNMLRTHYRQPMDWTVQGLKESERILHKWRTQLSAGAGTGYGLNLDDGSGYGDPFGDGTGAGYGGGDASFSSVCEALSDDLNTPFAITMMHAIGNNSELLQSAALLGIDLQSYARAADNAIRSKVDVAEVERLIAARNAARKAKNFKESDRIRDELAAKGIVLKDGPAGTTWEVKR
jgi:cysteinyl-tRNA synthetase